jgi:hypothetical protein
LPYFLQELVGVRQALPSDRANRLASSLGQDILYVLTNARVIKAENVFSPWVIKTLFASFYNWLEEIDTVLCIA